MGSFFMRDLVTVFTDRCHIDHVEDMVTEVSRPCPQCLTEILLFIQAFFVLFIGVLTMFVLFLLYFQYVSVRKGIVEDS